jgi:hypothetical protein
MFNNFQFLIDCVSKLIDVLITTTISCVFWPIELTSSLRAEENELKIECLYHIVNPFIKIECSLLTF